MHDVRKELIELSKAVRNFHKVLLNHTQNRYQEEVEVVGSPFAWLQIVVSHPYFEWLRPLTGYLTTLDEVTDSKTPLTEKNWEDAVHNLNRLFSPLAPEFKDFQTEYNKLKDLPDVKAAEERFRSLTRENN